MNKRILCVAMVMTLFVTCYYPVSATTISEAKKQKSAAESKLKSVNDDIEEIEMDKEAMEEEAAEREAELVDLLLAIDVIKGDIKNKEKEIEIAQEEYDAALEKEKQQKIAMDKRIKFMYEKGEESYVERLLISRSYVEALNKASYTEKLYEYDRYLLFQYQQTKEEVKEKKEELENDLEDLEEIKADAEEQQAALEEKIDEYSEMLEDFDLQLAACRSKAKEYQAEITKQANSIKELEAEERRRIQEEARRKAEEEARRKAEEAAARKRAEEAAAAEKKSSEDSSDSDSESSDSHSESSSSSSSESSSSSSGGGGGSARGQEIANFACQFVGNPYVAGGTSLTEGCDCSGFTSAVYSNFGISLPRTSGSQAGYGREVSYSEAAPGDIIYYGGHVGIYIGNGLIVHASTPATGIKITNALYRSIISVRRIV